MYKYTVFENVIACAVDVLKWSITVKVLRRKISVGLVGLSDS